MSHSSVDLSSLPRGSSVEVAKIGVYPRDVSTSLDIRGKKTKFSLFFPCFDRSGETSRHILKVQSIETLKYSN